MKRPFASKLLQLIMILVALLILGCESADIETGTATTSSGSSSSDGSNTSGTPPNGNPADNDTRYQTIAVAPASGVHTTVGDFTILEISQVPGYIYTWTLSDPLIGNISPTQGNKVTYFTTSIPSSGTAPQTITVTGTKAGNAVKYRGSSTITHRAP